MTDKLSFLANVLDLMLEENVTITARAVVRRSENLFKHASDITRDVKRREKLEAAIERQAKVRKSVARSSKLSAADLELMLATKTEVIERLQGERELLIASHKAMILAVSEAGGFEAWRRFFGNYEQSLDKLADLGALPS